MIAQLYSLFYDEMLGFAQKLMRDRAAAEDLVQETFLRALSNTDTLDALTRAQCRAWLYRTLRNLVIDRCRRERLAPVAEVSEGPAATDDLSAVLVHEALGILSDEERPLFLLRYMEGYTSKELGRMLELPPSTVRARLAAARKKLATQYYSPQGGNEHENTV